MSLKVPMVMKLKHILIPTLLIIILLGGIV